MLFTISVQRSQGGGVTYHQCTKVTGRWCYLPPVYKGHREVALLTISVQRSQGGGVTYHQCRTGLERQKSLPCCVPHLHHCPSLSAIRSPSDVRCLMSACPPLPLTRAATAASPEIPPSSAGSAAADQTKKAGTCTHLSDNDRET